MNLLEQHREYIRWIYLLKTEFNLSNEFDNHLKYCNICVKECGADFLYDL